MSKIYFKNISSLLATATLSLWGLFVGAPQAFADIPGRYLTADLTLGDLTGIVSNHPNFFWGLLIAFVIFCVGYGIFLVLQKKK